VCCVHIIVRHIRIYMCWYGCDDAGAVCVRVCLRARAHAIQQVLNVTSLKRRQSMLHVLLRDCSTLLYFALIKVERTSFVDTGSLSHARSLFESLATNCENGHECIHVHTCMQKDMHAKTPAARTAWLWYTRLKE